jgi:hypothetical protein
MILPIGIAQYEMKILSPLRRQLVSSGILPGFPAFQRSEARNTYASRRLFDNLKLTLESQANKKFDDNTTE